jgi:hypothetical protein
LTGVGDVIIPWGLRDANIMISVKMMLLISPLLSISFHLLDFNANKKTKIFMRYRRKEFRSSYMSTGGRVKLVMDSCTQQGWVNQLPKKIIVKYDALATKLIKN